MKKQKRDLENEYKKMSEAAKFLSSIRGNYIVGQALHIAHDQLVNSEPSNAHDMRYIGENLFMMGWSSHQLMQQFKIKGLTNKKIKGKIKS
jgi:hypothetical protein